MRKIKESKKNRMTLIKKSNDLIEARYMFDVWETRFFLAVLSQIHRDDKEFHVYRIRFKDIIKTFGLRSNSSYDFLRQAAKSIMNRKVAVAYEKEGTTREVLYHIIRKVDYLKEGEPNVSNEKHEYIDVMIEDEMKPFLLELQKNFTYYDLRNVVKLGVYPIRIYELLKQYEGIGKRTLKVEEIKRMFELTTEYPRFSNFYQKIIQPAIREINQHTDLNIIDVIKIKEDRNVTALQFIFNKKDASVMKALHKQLEEPTKKPSLTLFDDVNEPNSRVEEEQVNLQQAENEEDRLFSQYQQQVTAQFGVTPSIFLKALVDKQEQDITQAIRITAQAQKTGEVKNLAGFFIEALRQGFTNEKEEKKKKEKNEQAIKMQIALLKEQRDKAINDKIRSLTSTNPAITNEAIEKVQQSKAGQFRLKSIDITVPTTEDFRNDPILRDFVKNAIMETYSDSFEVIFNHFDRLIKEIL